MSSLVSVRTPPSAPLVCGRSKAEAAACLSPPFLRKFLIEGCPLVALVVGVEELVGVGVVDCEGIVDSVVTR